MNSSPTDRSRVALWGLFGVGNLGNEASLSVALERLRTFASPVEAVCVCRVETRVQIEHGVPTHPIRLEPTVRWITRAPRPVRLLLRIPIELARVVTTTRFLLGTDIVIAPGTGVLDDFDVSALDEPFDLWIWTILARLTRTPFWFVSVGAGPIDGRASRALMLSATKHARISYRDEGSRTFMSSIGHDVRSETVVPDLVFSVPRPKPEGAPSDGGPTVGLGVMAYGGWRRGDPRSDAIQTAYVAKVIELCGWFLDRGWTVVLLVGEDSDRVVVERIKAEVIRVRGSSASAALVTDEVSAFDDLLEVISGVDLVVATRFHNIVAALIAEKPVVSLEYASKNRRVMGECGLGDFCHHVETFTVEEITADVERSLETFAARRPLLVAGIERNRMQLDAQWAEIESSIQGLRGSRRPSIVNRVRRWKKNMPGRQLDTP